MPVTVAVCYVLPIQPRMQCGGSRHTERGRGVDARGRGASRPRRERQAQDAAF